GVVRIDALGFELFLKPGIIENDDRIAFFDLTAVINQPSDGSGVGAALGSRADFADDVAVAGRLQGAAGDDGDLKDLLLDDRGGASERRMAENPAGPQQDTGNGKDGNKAQSPADHDFALPTPS